MSGIIDHDAKRITKGCDGLVEGDPMLPFVLNRLLRVPFESEGHRGNYSFSDACGMRLTDRAQLRRIWCGLEDALRRLSYKNTRNLLRKAGRELAGEP